MQMPHLRLLLFLLLAAGFWLESCAPADSSEQTPDVRLTCSPKSIGEGGAPNSAVYTLVGNQKVKIANIAACDSIPASDYAEYGIPDTALAAVGGWHAGSGDYLFAVARSGEVIYYQGWAEEQQEDGGYHYTQLGVYTNGEFELQLPPQREELVGTYTLSQETGSHILFVGMRGDTLIGEHFELDGILPPPNQLNVLMTGMAPQDSARLVLANQSFRFHSGLGDGTFKRTDDGMEVSLELNGGQRLTLRKELSEDYSIPNQ